MSSRFSRQTSSGVGGRTSSQIAANELFRGRHVVEPTELSDAEAARFFAELLHVGRAIEGVFEPVKVNYDILGNSVPHLHVQVIPRYADDPRPEWPFPFPPEDPPPFPDAELRADAERLRAASR